MRCPPISQHHRRGRRAGAEASRLINETGHAPRIGAGNGALGQTTARGSGARPAHWDRQRCIGADNGPGIRGTPRALGQATVHWGRQIAYSNACFPAPMRLTVLGGALQPWSRATECGQKGAVGAQIRPTGIISGADRLRPTHAPLALRFHSDTAIRVGGSAGLSRTAALFSERYHTFTGIPVPATAQRTRETLEFRGKVFANHPQQARLPFENTTSLAKHPEPPSLDHSALRDKGTSSASTSPARSWANAGPHWGRKQRIGAGNRSLGQANNLPQCGLTCPNGTRGAREGAVRAQ